MRRKIVQSICVIELILAIVMYFTVAFHFENDAIINAILPSTDFEATVLRLSIYIIPGLNIVSGVFGITFATRGILFLAGILEILGGWMTLYFKGESVWMNISGWLQIAMGVIFIICILTIKELKVSKKSSR